MTVLTADPVDVGLHWRDPTTWGPKGYGCRLCHDNSPVRANLCLPCLIRCTGWIASKVVRWIEVQDVAYTRAQDRKQALKLWHEDCIPSGIIAYAEKYGVWLADINPS